MIRTMSLLAAAALLTACATTKPTNEVQADMPVAKGTAQAGAGHTITLKGNALPLAGEAVEIGKPLPAAIVSTTDLKPINLADSTGKVRVISVVPSLDTPTCDAQTHELSEKNGGLDKNVELITVSMDLPFAQKRWCGAENATNIQALSDHRTAKFGEAYGVLVQGGPLDRCLARAIFVVGPDDTIKHVEYVKEITEHPNYDAALAAAKG
jgi:thiol peroxidase